MICAAAWSPWTFGAPGGATPVPIAPPAGLAAWGRRGQHPTGREECGGPGKPWLGREYRAWSEKAGPAAVGGPEVKLAASGGRAGRPWLGSGGRGRAGRPWPDREAVAGSGGRGRAGRPWPGSRGPRRGDCPGDRAGRVPVAVQRPVDTARPRPAPIGPQARRRCTPSPGGPVTPRSSWTVRASSPATATATQPAPSAHHPDTGRAGRPRVRTAGSSCMRLLDLRTSPDRLPCRTPGVHTGHAGCPHSRLHPTRQQARSTAEAAPTCGSSSPKVRKSRLPQEPHKARSAATTPRSSDPGRPAVGRTANGGPVKSRLRLDVNRARIETVGCVRALSRLPQRVPTS